VDDRPDPARPPELAFAPDRRLVAGTVVLAAVAAVAAWQSPDAAGRLLFALAALVLGGYALVDLIGRPRLAAGPDGLRLRTPLRRVHLRWADVSAVRADVRHRHGLRTVTLEVDAAERLCVFSRRALGADPERVAELLRSYLR
jgi:hypothetical protein